MKLLVKIYYCNDEGEKFFGYGPYLLLKEVQKTNSLRQAALNLNMAYTKALKLITAAEKQFNCVLIERIKGGKGGGGSRITIKAEELIKEYEKLKTDIDEYSNTRFNELFEKRK